MRMIWKIGAGVAGAVVVVFAALLITGLVAQHNDEKRAEEMKRACANEIARAVMVTKTADQAEALVRIDPKSRKVCADLEMNGVAIIPK